MFRHKGKTRTLSHNLQIASLLSFVAGMVNVAGFLAVQRLTTNVTGHFAFFVDEVFKLNFWGGFVYLAYIICFLLGAFVANFLIEVTTRKGNNDLYSHLVPAAIECMLLLSVGIWGQANITTHPETIAYTLLFAMGLQNALVTTISRASVRTTHLTGLFTDLGIELSQLFFYTTKEQQQRLRSSIKLRLTIISFFFLGGVLSGVLYTHISLHVLLLATTILATGLIYDSIKFKVLVLKRKLRQ